MTFKIETFKDFFQNYEFIKLDIFQPDHANFLLIFLFIVLIMLTITKKTDPNPSEKGLLSLSHTDQLRGIAIFFVVLGHLWVHVSSPFKVVLTS